MSEWIIGFYAGVAFAAVLMFLELLLMRKAIDLLGEAIRIIFGKKEADGCEHTISADNKSRADGFRCKTVEQKEKQHSQALPVACSPLHIGAEAGGVNKKAQK